MKVVKNLPSDRKIKDICDFVNAHQRETWKVLTESMFKSILQSGGSFTLSEEASKIFSITIYLGLSVHGREICYVTHFASDCHDSLTVINPFTQFFTEERNREAKYSDAILLIELHVNSTNTDEYSVCIASYTDYIAIEPNAPKMSKKSWDNISYKKFSGMKNDRIICVFILWPATVLVNREHIHVCSLFSVSVEDNFISDDVLECMRLAACELVSSPRTIVAILRSSNICPSYRCFASINVAKYIDSDIFFVA